MNRKKLDLFNAAKLFPGYYLKKLLLSKSDETSYNEYFNIAHINENESIVFIQENNCIHVLNINCILSLTTLESALLNFRLRLKKSDVIIFYYVSQQWVFQNFLPAIQTNTIEEKKKFKINYDANSSTLEILQTQQLNRNKNSEKLLLKLFSYEQIEITLSKIGFIVQTDASFTKSMLVENFVITKLMDTIPESLAIKSYHSIDMSKIIAPIDLRWSIDEKNYLDIDLNKMIASYITTGLSDINKLIAAYQVNDPYGAKKISAAASIFFKKEIQENMIVLTAGVSSALYCLSRIITHSIAGCGPYTYPDLPSWLLANGNKVLKIDLDKSISELEHEIINLKIQLIILDNPNFLGKEYNKKFIVALSKIIQKNNGYLIIDESNANYLSASTSLVHILDQTMNVIVCRGFSKGYCLGGLRAGLIFFSAPLEGLIKRCIPILQTSELSTQLACMLLSSGDVFIGLRSKIKKNWKSLEKILLKEGYQCANTNVGLPWILLHDDNETIYRDLLSQGILTKPQRYFEHSNQVKQNFLRLCIPLDNKRLQKFKLHICIKVDK